VIHNESLRIMSLPKMQEKFREEMGEPIETDFFWCHRCQQTEPYSLYSPLIRLPLPVDPINPERGLWGMVNKDKYAIELNGFGATVTQFYSADGTTPYNITTYNTPTVALLRALMHQFGIEVTK